MSDNLQIDDTSLTCTLVASSPKAGRHPTEQTTLKLTSEKVIHPVNRMVAREQQPSLEGQTMERSRRILNRSKESRGGKAPQRSGKIAFIRPVLDPIPDVTELVRADLEAHEDLAPVASDALLFDSVKLEIENVIGDLASPLQVEVTPKLSSTCVALVTIESPGGIAYRLAIDVSAQNWRNNLERSVREISSYCCG